MAFNNVPVNGWPQIKDLEKLDAIAKQIEDMPTFTSDDKAFLADLPAYPTEDGTKVLTATTSGGETNLSYEDKSDLPADPQTDGTRVLTATTDNGETVKSWEDMRGVDYSTTEKKTGQKWIDGKDIYFKTVNFGALPDNTNKSVPHDISNIDLILFKSGIAYNEDKSTELQLPHIAFGSLSYYSISLDVNKTNVVITTGTDRTSLTDCFVTVYYTKITA